MRLYSALFVLLLAGCTSPKNDATEKKLNDSLQRIQRSVADEQKHDDLQTNLPRDTATNGGDDDCVFDNGYKGLIHEWLTELKVTNFIWREDLYSALIPQGQDTVYLSKGGCSHFVISVELKITNEQHSLLDSVYWKDKALQLADEYGMGHYSRMIKENKTKLTASEGKVWFEVDDDDNDDNLIYNGIEVTRENGGVRLGMSQYYN